MEGIAEHTSVCAASSAHHAVLPGPQKAADSAILSGGNYTECRRVALSLLQHGGGNRVIMFVASAATVARLSLQVLMVLICLQKTASINPSVPSDPTSSPVSRGSFSALKTSSTHRKYVQHIQFTYV